MTHPTLELASAHHAELGSACDGTCQPARAFQVVARQLKWRLEQFTDPCPDCRDASGQGMGEWEVGGLIVGCSACERTGRVPKRIDEKREDAA